MSEGLSEEQLAPLLEDILNRAEFADLEDPRVRFWRWISLKALQLLAKSGIFQKGIPILASAGEWIGFAMILVAIVLVGVALFYVIDRMVLSKRKGLAETEKATPLADPTKREVEVEGKLADAIRRKAWIEAVRFRYELMVARLRIRVSISGRTDETFGEIQREILKAVPHSATISRELTDQMNLVCYGSGTADESLFRWVSEKTDRVERSER